MVKSILKKSWWLLLLLVFDFTYYYFIKHITTPKTNSFWIPVRWDGFLFVFLISLLSLACVRWVKSRLDQFKTISIPVKYLQMLIYSFLLFISITAGFQLLIEYLMGQQRSLEYVISNGLVFTFLHAIVGNAYVAIEFFRESSALRENLLRTEKAKTESELKVLQQQMDPHFLFNNLNTLTSLIPQAPEKAVDFTQTLSQLFRYISSSGKKDIISLQEELRFLDHYMELLKIRFGTAYRIVNQLGALPTDRILVVPLVLQVALENVIKHNSGSRSRPLEIIISHQGRFLFIQNEIRKKPGADADKSGIGLINLQERYQLITGHTIQYGASNGCFSVQLPLIKSIDDESLTH